MSHRTHQPFYLVSIKKKIIKTLSKLYFVHFTLYIIIYFFAVICSLRSLSLRCDRPQSFKKKNCQNNVYTIKMFLIHFQHIINELYIYIFIYVSILRVVVVVVGTYTVHVLISFS